MEGAWSADTLSLERTRVSRTWFQPSLLNAVIFRMRAVKEADERKTHTGIEVCHLSNLFHGENKKQCSRQLQCEVPCR